MYAVYHGKMQRDALLEVKVSIGNCQSLRGGQKMANKKRLIDANALEKMLNNESIRHASDKGKMFKMIKDSPTVDAVEVVHAYWKGDEPGDWHCSHCGEYAADGGYEQTNYCPNCGAKMDGERKDNG